MTVNQPRLSPAEMAELSSLAFRIAHNPKTRSHFATLVNEVDPNAALAGFGDVAVQRQIAALKADIANERQQEKVNRVAEANEAQKREVLKRYGHGEETAKRLDEIRAQYGLSDWNAAALIYAGSNPPDNPGLKPPPEMDGSTWEFPTVPGPDGQMLKFADYVKDPRRYSNKTAYRMISEFKRERLPSAFRNA
jgi:hypothetical protein